MLGIWLENKKIKLRDDLMQPMPDHDEVLVKVMMAGICNTDIEMTKGYYPYSGILGHEFVGQVVSGSSHLKGKRVVGEINVVCNQCEFCLSDNKNHCVSRKVLGIINKNGAFAEYLTLSHKNLHLVPDNVSTEEASFAEPLAAALEIKQQVDVRPNDKVLVIGDGKLGILISQCLLLNGCELWVLGRHQKKCDILEKRGAIIVKEGTLKPGYFDCVIECTGNPTGFNEALRAIKPRGKLIIKSTYAGNLNINVSSIVVNELCLLGSRCGPIQPALQMLSRKLIDTQSLIDQIYPLTRGIEAFEHAKRKGSLKILIEPNVENN